MRELKIEKLRDAIRKAEGDINSFNTQRLVSENNVRNYQVKIDIEKLKLNALKAELAVVKESAR